MGTDVTHVLEVSGDTLTVKVNQCWRCQELFFLSVNSFSSSNNVNFK